MEVQNPLLAIVQMFTKILLDPFLYLYSYAMA